MMLCVGSLKVGLWVSSSNVTSWMPVRCYGRLASISCTSKINNPKNLSWYKDIYNWKNTLSLDKEIYNANKIDDNVENDKKECANFSLIFHKVSKTKSRHMIHFNDYSPTNLDVPGSTKILACYFIGLPCYCNTSTYTQNYIPKCLFRQWIVTTWNRASKEIKIGPVKHIVCFHLHRLWVASSQRKIYFHGHTIESASWV
jgi:hypothetical protein